MEKILEALVRGCPGSQVILLGLLPRGTPDDAGAIRWPSKYARGLLAVNARYEAAAAKCAPLHSHLLQRTQGRSPSCPMAGIKA